MSPTAVTATGMLPVVFDPGTPDALDINDGHGYVVHADLSMPPPAAKPQYASSIDTEGSRPVPDSAHYENREIGLKVRVYGDAEMEVEDRLAVLYQRLGKIQRKGGVLGVTTPAGRTILFDLVGEADGDTVFDERWPKLNKTDMEIRLVAAPFWRGEELELGTFTETSNPALIFTVHDVPGDVPALGRLVVTDLSGFNQWTVVVGVQHEHWSPNPEAALYLPASQITPLGASFRFGPVIANNSLSGSWQSILKSTFDPSLASLEHKGSFRVWARIQRNLTNIGSVSVRLEWGEGDYLFPALNDPVSYAIADREGALMWVDLGVVTPSEDSWEFRLLAKSTGTNDNVTVESFLLFPTAEGYTKLSARARAEAPVSFIAQDDFNQATVGDALNGKTAPTGGAWATSGQAGDFALQSNATVDNNPPTAQWLTRTTVSATDINSGRYAISGAAALTDLTVQVETATQGFVGTNNNMANGIARQGLLARYVDANNWLRLSVELQPSATVSALVIDKRVAGTVTELARFPVSYSAAVNYWLRLTVDSAGRWFAWFTPDGVPFGTLFSGADSVLATGGALASGKVGFYDAKTDTDPVARFYDVFSAWVPTILAQDAAMYANRSLELTHQSARREAVDGAGWSPMSDPARGPYLHLQPGTNRLVVKALRADIEMTNPDVDDIEAELFCVPRGLVVPAA